MRTTISISDSVYREAKARAALTGQSVSQVIEDAVRAALQPPEVPVAPLPPLPTFGGSGVLPGVDLGDSSSLVDLMDEGRSLDALR